MEHHPWGVSCHWHSSCLLWHYSHWTLWFWLICDCIFSTTKSSWCSHSDET
jgi:hypothetical protein